MKKIRSDTARARAPAVILALLLFAGFSPGVASAAVDPVGRVISASGEVTAVRAGESARSLARGEAVYEGDEIRTGEHGNTQIRFDDGGLFDLDPETRFAVDRYRVEDDGGGSAVMSFLRGALRTITGSIGSSSGGTYRLGTPTATLGVRGTAYALSYCDAACAQDHGGQPGLYGRVDDGIVSVRTARGSADQRAGQFFFVPQGGTPRVILRPPSGILDRGGSEPDAGARGAVEEGAAATPLTRERTDGGPYVLGTPGAVFESVDLFESVGEVTGIGGAGAGSAGISDSNSPFFNAELFNQRGPFQVNDLVQVIGASLDKKITVNSTLFSTSVGGARLAEANVMPDLSVGWGRWEGQFDVVGVPGKSHKGHLAYTVTNNLTQPSTLANLSGTLNYALAGGPRAFDRNGFLWKVNALSMNVNFSGGGTVGLNRFELAGSGNRIVFAGRDVANQVMDIPNNNFSMELKNTSNDLGTIGGKFVGVNAEGAIVVFGIDSAPRGQTIPANNIVGTKVLRKQ